MPADATTAAVCTALGGAFGVGVKALFDWWRRQQDGRDEENNVALAVILPRLAALEVEVKECGRREASYRVRITALLGEIRMLRADLTTLRRELECSPLLAGKSVRGGEPPRQRGPVDATAGEKPT